MRISPLARVVSFTELVSIGKVLRAFPCIVFVCSFFNEWEEANGANTVHGRAFYFSKGITR